MYKTGLACILATILLGCGAIEEADNCPLVSPSSMDVAPVYSGQHSWLVQVLYYTSPSATQPAYEKHVLVRADTQVQAVVRAMWDASSPWRNAKNHNLGIWTFSKAARLY